LSPPRVWARVPIVPIAAAFAAGVAASAAVPPLMAAGCAVIAIASALAFAALGRLGPSMAGLLVATAALGALRAMPPPLPADHVSRLALPASATVEGALVGDPIALGPDRTRVLLEVREVDGLPRSGRALLTVYGTPPPLTARQRVRGAARLDVARGYRNPGVFDQGARLRREGIHVVGSVRGDRLLLLDDPPPAWNARARRAAIETMERTLPPASAALLAGLVLGDRSALPPAIAGRFREAGVAHVLAVSGFNVALVAGAVLALAAFARVPGRRPPAPRAWPWSPSPPSSAPSRPSCAPSRWRCSCWARCCSTARRPC
jgi:competence protein ComEC